MQQHWCVATKQFNGNGAGLSSLTASEVQWVHSANGPKMVEQPDTEFTLDVDLVLLALGYDAPAPAPLAEQLDLQADPHGRLVLNDHATSQPGIFAAGDLASGAALVVNAIASGRKVAEKIDRYLMQ